jgi:hypothetical protein
VPGLVARRSPRRSHERLWRTKEFQLGAHSLEGDD